MNFTADQVKEQEIRGSIAAFCDAGLVKVANEEGFNMLCDAVFEKVADDYDLNSIATAVDEVINEASGAQEMQKKASDELALKAAVGELALMKLAGKLDDNAFVAEVGSVMKEAGLVDSQEKKAEEMKALPEGKKSLGRKVLDTVKKNKGKAGAVAGLAVAGGLGKALYDKYKD